MSNQFLKLRRSAVPGRVPSTSSIDFGEIALNTYDGLAFIKRSGSLGEEVVTLGSREGAFTGSFSGSFVGNGGGLFNIPASGIVGLNLSQIATGSVTASVSTGAGSFSLVSGSSTFLYVASSGNVGIGTSTPSAVLAVNGNDNNQIQILDEGGSVGYLYGSANGGYMQLVSSRPALNLVSSGRVAVTSTVVGNGTVFGVSYGANTFVVDKQSVFGSNVLLGTINDTGERLQVSGSARITNGLVVTGSTTIVGDVSTGATLTIGSATGNAGSLKFFNGNVGIDRSGASGLLFRVGSNSIAATITQDRLVGIGTESPTALLHVSGTTQGLFQIGGTAGSNILYVSSSGNVGINTNTPQDQFHVSNTLPGFNTIIRLSVHPNHANIISFRNADGTGQGGFLATGATFSYGTYVANQTNLSGGSGGIGLRVGNTSSSSLAVYGGNADSDFGTKYLQLFGNTGNLLLQNGGTFTDTSERLQVSGSARITNALVVTGSITSNTNVYSPLFQGPANVQLQYAGNNSYVRIEDTGNVGNGISFRVNNLGNSFKFSHNNNISFTLGYVFGGGSNMAAWFGNSTSLVVVNPSAQVQIDSITKGVLLPRMTEAQRLAISAPAQGLLVYDTGSATEGLWYYNSGSNPGWQEVLTNSGSQTISGSITANNITVTGTLTAQTIVAQTITSSTDYVSGSTIFGNSLSNTHQFTGSVSITGSLSLPYLSTGSVLFAGATDNITEDNANFFWDNTNKRLGIGTNAPPARLTVWDGDIFIRSDYSIRSGTALNSYPSVTNRLQIYNSSNGEMAITMYNTSWWLRHNANASIAGNLIIGTTTDTGERLQVSGSSRFAGNMVITGSGNSSATTALTILDSDAVSMFRVRNDGRLYLGSSANAPYISAAISSNPSKTGTNTLFYNFTSNQTSDTGAWWFSGDAFTNTTGAPVAIYIDKNFTATSGTAAYSVLKLSPTINQTGGANGITRGLYINPTITAAADFRSIEWSTNAATAPSQSWGLYGAGTAPNFLSGSLGIGAFPTRKLDVSGSGVLAAFYGIGSQPQSIYLGGGELGTLILENQTNGGGDGINIYTMRGNTSFNIGYRTTSGANGAPMNIGNLTSYAAGNINFLQNGSVKLMIDTTGSIGIGTTTPAARLDVRGNTFVSGTLDILDAEINYQRNNNVTTGSARLIASIPTASLNAAFFDYVIVSGSNARAGTVTSVWVSSSVEWNETYTNDIGSTSDVTLYSAITGSSIGLFATSSINNVWTIKSLIRTI